ncbi:metal-dependent transcriptional regulator [Ancrocorticia populi]|uniref:metal-dependent transcriptional regulator n=1 Tax=Ancrocorticia populi TaxID=2175228 RepID=UPI003F8E978D
MFVAVSDLSVSAQNYLRSVWSLSEWTDAPVTTSLIAEKTGLKPSTVSDGIRKLTEQGLLGHAPYGAVTLTEDGRAYAVSMVRRHRLIETFLVEVLGYRWDQVDDEAEVLEHAVSDFMIEQIDQVLGHPSRDPHGDPIPLADGTLFDVEAAPLNREDVGSTVTVERISDADPELLQFFTNEGIRVGCEIAVAAGPPYAESVEVTVVGSAEADEGTGTAHSTMVGATAMAALFVSRADS